MKMSRFVLFNVCWSRHLENTGLQLRLSLRFCVCFSEMGADRASHPTAGPLPHHLRLHGGVEGRDGELQL